MTELSTKLQSMTPDTIMEKHGYRADLLLNAAIAAAAHPEKFDMGNWVRGNWVHPGHVEIIDAQNNLTCGTTLCLAGWIVYQNKPEVMKVNQTLTATMTEIQNSAYKLLTGKQKGFNDGSIEGELDFLFINTLGKIAASNVIELVEMFIEGGWETLRDELFYPYQEWDVERLQLEKSVLQESIKNGGKSLKPALREVNAALRRKQNKAE
jgi:hypothetical protein